MYTFVFCSELEATTEEYRLLEQMNKLTLTKYSDMSQITENITKYVQMLEIMCLYMFIMTYTGE